MSRKKLVAIIVSLVLVSTLVFLLIDLDGDGAINGQELFLSSDLVNPDSDSDGLTDGQEAELGTNPLVIDTDGDKLLDGNSILVSESDILCGQLKNEQILYRVQSNGKFEFYGEQYFSSNPCETSLDEANQAKFLASLSEQDYQELANQGLLFDNNLDDDSWSNYFEKEISNTHFEVKNEVYVVIMTQAGIDYYGVREMFEALEDMKIPSKNVYDLTSEKNNSVDFEMVISDISQKSTKNDLVIIILHGEGNNGNFGFKNVDVIVSYSWIGEKIDSIKAEKAVVVVDSCKSGSSIPFLEEPNRIILTSGTEDQETGFGVGWQFLKSFSKASADLDKNGYVSIWEAVNFVKEVYSDSITTPQSSDFSDIGKSSYLAEIDVR